LLPGGFDAKLTVDRAIALVSTVGNLLNDITRCKVGLMRSAWVRESGAAVVVVAAVLTNCATSS
jgi:hypothetical protein